MTRRGLQRLLAVLGIGILAHPLEAQIRDSAGIRIVENARPLLPPARMWRLSPQPIVQIGKADGDSLYEFLRVTGVARLSDGRIAVANDGTRTVRFYDSHGVYLGAFGRSGDGPGEFRQILQFRRMRGDSFAVGDLSRVSYFSGQGRFGHSISASAGHPFVYVWAFLADGSYLGAPGYRMGPAMPRSGRWVDSVTIFHVGPGAEAFDTLGRFPRGVSHYSSAIRGNRQVVFGPRFQVTAGADEVYVGFGDRFELQVLTTSGNLRRIIRRTAPRRPVPAEAIREYRERLTNAPGEDGKPAPTRLRELRARLAQEVAFASELPAYSTLHVDLTGHLWVQQFETWEDAPDRYGPLAVYTDPRPSLWDVFDPRGAWLGRLEMPGNFAPLEIGEDYVAGLWRDAEDVEYIRLYRLFKP